MPLARRRRHVRAPGGPIAPQKSKGAQGVAAPPGAQETAPNCSERALADHCGHCGRGTESEPLFDHVKRWDPTRSEVRRADSTGRKQLEDIPKDRLSTQIAGLRIASRPLPKATSSDTELMNAPQAQWEAWRFQWRCVQRVCVLCSCSLRTRVCRYALAR
eukprot:10611772-Alexandrium_andersonii.AAC.1